MPSATRKTKANSGSEGSAPGKPKITSKTTEPTPIAAAKDTITVPISRSGSVSARSSATRIRKTTSTAIGMMSRVSRAADWRKSCSTAVGPPTSVLWPPARLTTSRRPGMRSKASVE